MKLGLAILAACSPVLLALAPEDSRAAADAGERAYQKCYSCHSLTTAEKLEGPSLAGIVGRRVAGQAGFDYSPALKRFATSEPSWTPELLDRFIADPEALVPGTSMAFGGIQDAAERAALVAYLERGSQPGR